jgi:hypothetical protein
MRNTIWVAGLAFTFGCAMFGGGSQETKKSETRTAQDQAHKSLQQAADAQKKANEEQAKVEKFQQDVTQKQKDLADAQARLKGQIAKAEQAQRDAQEANRLAQQEASQQQRQAAEKQRSETQQMTSSNQERQQTLTQEKRIRGRVVQAQGSQLQVRTEDQEMLQLDVTDATSVKLNGQSASVSQIQPGADVRASYQMVDGKAKALEIDATSKASGQ